MRNFATTGLLLATFFMLAAPAVQAQTQEINTGTVQTVIFDNGNFGDDCSGTYTGFVFNGVNGICGGTFLLGIDASTVIGHAYHPPSDPTSEWTPGTIGSSTDFPYPTLNQGVNSTFSDAAGMGINVELNAYYGTDTDFVVFKYDITNNTGGSLDNIYPGMWLDWDVNIPEAATNVAAVDTDANVQYIWDSTGGVAEYFGQAVLSDDLSGWGCFINYGEDDGETFTAMTTPGANPCDPADMRGPIAAGPYTIADTETITVVFAVLGGSDDADIIANAVAAQEATVVAIEPGPDGLPGTHNLSSVYPNPFNPTASFNLEVAEQQNVRIALVDALGREVATLFEGTLSAGPAHQFQIDGENLPSGLYLVRATGERFAETRQVTLLK